MAVPDGWRDVGIERESVARLVGVFGSSSAPLFFDGLRRGFSFFGRLLKLSKFRTPSLAKMR